MILKNSRRCCCLSLPLRNIKGFKAMKKHIILPITLIFGLLTACGGGGGGSSSNAGDAPVNVAAPAPASYPSIDTQLLDAPLLVIDDVNAQIDVLDEVIFALRLVRDFSFIFTAPLISNAIHGLSFENLSKTYLAAHCRYTLMDNDNSSTLTAGDVVNVDFLDCPDVQQLVGKGTGLVKVTITKVVNDGTEAVIDSVVEFTDFTFTTASDIAIKVIGETVVKSENPSGTVSTRFVNEVSAYPGKAVQLQVEEDKFILVDPIYRDESIFNSGLRKLTLGASKVADSTLGATYRCPNATLTRSDPHGNPQSGVLIHCEGNNSAAALQVSFFEFELADLVVNTNATSVRWDEVAGFLLGERIGHYR